MTKLTVEKLITGETAKDTTAAIKASIDSIQRRGKKLDQDIWVTAVSAMQHHDQHGDTTLINRLVAAMPKGSRVNALRDFIAVHGKVVYNEETKVFDHDKEGNFDLEGALSLSWVEFKPEPEYTVVTVESLLSKLVKDANRKTTDKTKIDITEAQRAKIVAFAADMGVTVKDK